MDRTYIQSQHIVERYLSGDLSVREARDFEKFCGENPDILNSLPIPVRVKARMTRKPGADLESGDFDPTATDTSIVAAGLDADEDDPAETPRGFRGLPHEARRWAVVLGVSLAIAVVGAGALWLRVGNLERQLKNVQRAAQAVQMRAPAEIREYRVRPSTSKPSAPTVQIGMPDQAQWIDLRVDFSESRYNTFLVTIENVELGRVIQIRRVARDSNRELRLSINSSALSAGDYDVKFEGYTWQGKTVLVGWARLGMK